MNFQFNFACDGNRCFTSLRHISTLWIKSSNHLFFLTVLVMDTGTKTRYVCLPFNLPTIQLTCGTYLPTYLKYLCSIPIWLQYLLNDSFFYTIAPFFPSSLPTHLPVYLPMPPPPIRSIAASKVYKSHSALYFLTCSNERLMLKMSSLKSHCSG